MTLSQELVQLQTINTPNIGTVYYQKDEQHTQHLLFDNMQHKICVWMDDMKGAMVARYHLEDSKFVQIDKPLHLHCDIYLAKQHVFESDTDYLKRIRLTEVAAFSSKALAAVLLSFYYEASLYDTADSLYFKQITKSA